MGAKTYDFFIDRLKKKLAGWKRNTLSKVARLLLINTIIATTYAYVMQSTVIPHSTIATLEKIHRKFFWDNSNTKSKLHLIVWERICRLKELGRLVVPNL